MKKHDKRQKLLCLETEAMHFEIFLSWTLPSEAILEPTWHLLEAIHLQ